MKTYLGIFVAILLAELGDKTQLATFLLAATPGMSRVSLVFAAGAALVLSTVIAVLVGGELGRLVAPRVLRLVAGVGFLAIGTWLIVSR